MLPKLILFDLEGTLIKKVSLPGPGDISSSMWTVVAESLGPNAMREEEQTKSDWNDGKYSSPKEWAEASLQIHKKYGLTKSRFEELVHHHTHPHNHVEETLKELKKKQIKIGIISGGFTYQANLLKNNHSLDIAIASCDYNWTTDGELNSWNLTYCDYEGKAQVAKTLLQQLGYEAKDCAFVGDGSNDRDIAQLFEKSIAFNASPKLQAVCKYSINQPRGQEDFFDVLKILIN